MRVVVFVFSLTILSLILAPFDASAERSAGEIHTGQWNGAPYHSEDGQFSHCFISADYETGIRILFILGRDYNFSMAFIRPEWHLTIGKEYTVKYWIDKYMARSGTAVAKGEGTASMDLDDTMALFEEMRKGYTLYVRTGSQDFIFNLKDTYRALKDLSSCVNTARKNQTGHEKGLEAWRSGNYFTAHKIFLPLAEQGNADSQFSLGVLYDKGQGVQKDSAEAIKWLRKAAEQNYASAQYVLGYMYGTGRGTPKDSVKAARWYRLAADQGNALGQFSLGFLYETGEGVRQDFAEAAKWYTKAADQGNVVAQSNLGVLYGMGQGVTKDYFRAFFWASLAASQGHKKAIEGQKILARHLTSVQIAEVKTLVENWRSGEGQAFAFNNRNSSIQAVPQHNAEPPASTKSAATKSQNHDSQPDDIAVIIGNADYEQHGRDIPNVVPAVNDAKAVKRYFSQALGVKDGNIIYLENATSAEMVGVFGNERSHKGKLFNWVKPNKSRVYVYYSGHGAPGSKNGGALLVPANATADSIDLTGYPLATLYENLGRLPAKSVTVVLEACFSGLTQAGWLSPKASGISVSYRPPQIPKNLTVITAGAADQTASWKKDESNSLFTSYFLKGMFGEADKAPYGNKDGKVSYPELGRYLDGTLTYDARRNYGRDQKAQIVVGRGR